LEPAEQTLPKRVPPLSAKALASTRSRKKPVELVDGFVPGLRARITQIGTLTWSLSIRDSKGKRRRFDVGQGLSLSEARLKAESLRRAIREGADPTKDRRELRRRVQAARNGIGTFEAMLDTFFRSGPGAGLKRATKTKNLLKAVFKDVLGSVLLDVDRATLQIIADEWRSPQTAAFAVRSLRPCLKWAEKRALIKAGLWDLDPPARTARRNRTLSSDELRAIWHQLSGRHGQVIQWLLWTGCRLNEAAEMTWDEIKSNSWTIPAARTKTKQDRIVPLPSQAWNLLDSIETSERGALVFPSARGGVLSNWDRETKRLQKRSGTAAWHRHDLRRTVATMLGDLGFAPHVIRAVLGHATSLRV
jgi:integrase